MKVIFTKLAAALLYVWQLPQNLLGLLLLAIYGRVIPIDFRGDGWRNGLPSSMLYFIDGFPGGISLGRYILVAGHYMTDSTVWYHERGHSIQSMILGPLYLLVIGLPSLIWAAWWNRDRDCSYYSFYTERWADRLGDVHRDE
jgi:hypothetical protein